MPFNPNPQDGRQPYLPTFQEVMLTYEYEDSMRLPSYQGRQLGRYHPYLRRSPPRLEGPSSMTRYMVHLSFSPPLNVCFPSDLKSLPQNTIYDEECVFLEVPSFAPPVSHGPPHQTPLTKFISAMRLLLHPKPPELALMSLHKFLRSF